MEGYSHSHSRSHSTFSGNKKPPLYQSTNNNVGGFFQTSYDDVFGGPPKYAALAPRAEDYSEIFGAFRSSSSSRASSIPVLDLPAVSDIDSISSSIFDYSEVFGGFHAVDFAVPYDQLFRPSECAVVDDDDASSDEAWTPVGTESLSDDSDPFAFSEKSQYFSNGNSHPASDTKQFNVSYHKVNPGTDTYMPNMTHVAQLNAVPGYTCVVDESTSSRKVGEESFCSAMVDDIVFSMDSVSQKRTGKKLSEMSNDDAGGKSLNSECRRGRANAAAASMSQVNSTSASVSEINIRTEPSHLPPPSRPPPIPAERKGDIGRMSSGFKASDSCAVNAAVDVRLPPCFDMEVDASSSAAASAAAMKDAMEKAQAKLKAAKVLMDRNKDGRQNTSKLVMKTGESGGCESVKVELDEYASRNDGQPVKMQNPGKERHTTTASQTVPETTAGEHPTFMTRKPAERKHKKMHTFSMDNAYIGGDGEWKAATQYYEFVNNDNTRSASPSSNNVDRKTAALDHHGDDEKCNLDSAEEACVPAENRPKLKVAKAVSRQEYYDKMVKVAQEAHDGVIIGQAEATDKLIGMPQGTHREQNVHVESEPVKNAEKIGKAQRTEEDSAETCRKQEADNRSKNTLEREEVKKKETFKKETAACHREQDDRNTIGLHHSRVKEVPERKEEDRRMRGSTERMESETRMQKVIVNEENEKRVKEACERHRKQQKLADVVKLKKDKERREVKEERSNDPFEDGFDGGRLQTACESQENGKTKDLKKVDGKTPKEAFEDVFLEERLQEACRSHDIDKTKDLKREVQDKTPREAFEDMLTEDRLQGPCRNQGNDKTKDLKAKVEHETSREGFGDVFVKERLQVASGSREIDEKKDLPQSLCENNGEVVDVRRSKNILPEYFELEECRKHSEAPEQVIWRQRLDEAHKLAADDKKSEDGQSQDENEEKPEKFAEERTLEDKAMPENEVEEAVKILQNNGDLEDQKLLNQRRIKVEWEDEDQGPDSSRGIELPMENGHVMSSDAINLAEKEVRHDALTSKLKKSQTEADGFQDVSSRKVNSEISDSPSIGESRSKTVGTADVLIDDKRTESTATQIGADDSEQGRRVNASDSLDRNEDDTKSGKVHIRSGQKLKEETKKVTPSVSDPNLEQEGKRRNLEEGLPRGQEQKVKSSPSEGINGRNEHTRKKEAAHNVMLERKESFQKRSQLPNISQTTERKGKIVNQNHSSEEKTKEKERDFESEQVRKLEEEREREREREKDRMAVEFAIREARERAYSDARERAALERATDEARQRAMAEARERLEKACAEARERSLADKASEARLKAERAAVERATAEARQRAIEKAMSERATLEARERMQRSISEKLASERDVVKRQSSMPSQSSERFEAADYEPAQRCKARLERHRRTVERVAKALAEKNMRDLVAQREQAERSRLAETLDADIKRWSNGKEGNLRALLSTLQYILGPDSGWQPIPLTEVITAAAVKKAYRKATLCVHPDKLQQRGASIQQKYICEKVFDLLKEAWNRFNSEEK